MPNYAVPPKAEANARSSDLKQYLWKSRVLLLLGDYAKDGETKSDQERDLVIIHETDAEGPLHRKFKAQKDTAVLIGKDGGEKWRATGALDKMAIYKEIDSMPMRQDEMKR